MDKNDQTLPQAPAPVGYPGGGAAPPQAGPAGTETRVDGFWKGCCAAPPQAGPAGTETRGDGFWKGCCAALCCCCVLDACF